MDGCVYVCVCTRVSVCVYVCTCVFCQSESDHAGLLGAGVLCDGLGSLGHGVLSQLSRQEETDSSLNLTAGDGRATVVVGETRGLCSDTFEDIVHKRVHDRHGLTGDASVGMNLFQHLVDVDGVALLPPPLAFPVAAAHSFCLAGGLLGSLGGTLGWHDDDYECHRHDLLGRTTGRFLFFLQFMEIRLGRS